jgi:hypothetical protein
MRKCIKTRFSALLTVKKIFFEEMILVVWEFAQMHKKSFLKKCFSVQGFSWFFLSFLLLNTSNQVAC